MFLKINTHHTHKNHAISGIKHCTFGSTRKFWFQFSKA